MIFFHFSICMGSVSSDEETNTRNRLISKIRINPSYLWTPRKIRFFGMESNNLRSHRSSNTFRVARVSSISISGISAEVSTACASSIETTLSCIAICISWLAATSPDQYAIPRLECLLQSSSGYCKILQRHHLPIRKFPPLPVPQPCGRTFNSL